MRTKYLTKAGIIAAYLTSKMPNKYLGMLPPVVLNALIVSIWVSYFFGIPYWATVAGIAIGEFLAVAVFGNLILYAYDRNSDRLK